MNPVLDQLLVALIVAVALLFLVRRLMAKGSSCGSGCCGKNRKP